MSGYSIREIEYPDTSNLLLSYFTIEVVSSQRKKLSLKVTVTCKTPIISIYDELFLPQKTKI